LNQRAAKEIPEKVNERSRRPLGESPFPPLDGGAVFQNGRRRSAVRRNG